MTRRHLRELPPAPFARHKGDRCRRWWSRNRPAETEAAAPADDFSRPRTAPVGQPPYPMAADLYLYSPKDAA